MAEPVRAFAPGRVNVIGEHTDYEEGLCLPFAIGLGVSVEARPLPGDEVEALALDLGQRDRFRIDGVRPPPPGWRRFVRGAVAELAREGFEVRPCRLEIAGTVPRGAGLASSAALTVALCLALCAAAGVEPPPPAELARACSRVESEWCGASTGLMDQLASLHGRAGHALRLDLRSLTAEPVPLALGDCRLAVLDSGAPRSLAETGYNHRRAECRRAAEALGVAALRDARPSDAGRLPEPLAARVRHVTSENARVDAAVEALRHADPLALARALDASHASLRDDFEASVPAVERALERCRAAGALGARMMGGGFGGSVLALFPPDAELPAGALEVEPGPGARLI
jgi:galactokinase